MNSNAVRNNTHQVFSRVQFKVGHVKTCNIYTYIFNSKLIFKFISQNTIISK